MKIVLVFSALAIILFFIDGGPEFNAAAKDKVFKPKLERILKGKDWRVVNREVSLLNENGRKAVKFSDKDKAGGAWLDTLTFKNGTIEFDARGRDVFQKSFIGVAFQAVDDNNYDLVYFRPFNFKADDPVRRRHAVQYMAAPDNDWKNLREKFPDQYEKGVEPAPNATDWFHARVEVDGKKVSVYVDNSATPSLVIEKLTESREGKIGLWVGDYSDGAFANLKITKKE